ncbi:MAG: DUF1549 and DUF1553 domain-containing protein [Fuerstiella sp.]|nr:DUF1549 and DUF1553 domain-containing protein [Fuerstiella sp.]
MTTLKTQTLTRNTTHAQLIGNRFTGDTWHGYFLCTLVLSVAVMNSATPGNAAESSEDDHWSYSVPQRPELPPVRDNKWAQNQIDAFVLHRLEQEGLAPSPAADRTTLIRRVTLDLTGLPPTPEEVRAFVVDQSDDAYVTVVDRLLQSVEYAERMTAWWLDLARYADTHGYESDGTRNIWLYRDWVIDAFHRGLSFDRFTIEQLAGDLLPNPTDSEQIATGFHRNTPFCYEAGTDPEQFRVESVIDRVNTTMTVWMGTTMGCAQCHDHKYDPFSQRDYFRLYAFFNNSADSAAERGTISATSPLERSAIAKYRTRLTELRRQYAGDHPELAARQLRWEAKIAAGNRWNIIVPTEIKSLCGADLELLDDHSILASGKNPDHDVYEISFPVPTSDLSGIGIEVLRHEKLPYGGPGRDEDSGNFDLSSIRLDYSAPGRRKMWQRVPLQSAIASYQADGSNITGAIDDDQNTRWCTDQEEAHATFVGDQTEDIPKGSHLRIRMSHDSRLAGHGVGRFRLWTYSDDSTEEPVKDKLAPLPTFAILNIPNNRRTELQRTQLTNYFRTVTPLLASVREEVQTLEEKSAPSSTLIMVENDEPRETRILHRGSFLDPGEQVRAGVPAAWHSWPQNEQYNRLGLARWLMRPENPLVARVTMNRIWALLFGKAIVETSEDLGIQGSPPSHPMLLDYLATEFVSRGWDLQAMQKLIVMSATYRQSSTVTPDRLRSDPDNRLFSRGPVFRLDAEMIRDNALAVSGLLTRQAGGPGVFPYQPPGVFEQIHSYSTQWELSTKGQQYRRALYTWWKRTAPYPSMITFDAPRRNICVERRPRTNTPLQALVTLNDPVFVQCAAALGRRMATEIDGDVRQKAAYGFRLCVARQPSPEEIDQLSQLYRKNVEIYALDPAAARIFSDGNTVNAAPSGVTTAELAAWAIIGNVLLNLDETLTKY